MPSHLVGAVKGVLGQPHVMVESGVLDGELIAWVVVGGHQVKIDVLSPRADHLGPGAGLRRLVGVNGGRVALVEAVAVHPVRCGVEVARAVGGDNRLVGKHRLLQEAAPAAPER
eukprot:scaffold54813_cov23-Prasinocladus_malaysianus.AAC.1